jgi:hypothetical protein
MFAVVVLSFFLVDSSGFCWLSSLSFTFYLICIQTSVDVKRNDKEKNGKKTVRRKLCVRVLLEEVNEFLVRKETEI